MNWKERVQDATRKRLEEDAEKARVAEEAKASAKEEKRRAQIEKEKNRLEREAETAGQRLAERQRGGERQKVIALQNQELAEKRLEANRQFNAATETLRELGVPDLLRQINKDVWKGMGSVFFKRGLFKGSIVATRDNPSLETTNEWPEWKLKFQYRIRVKEGYRYITTKQVPEMHTTYINIKDGNPPQGITVPTGRMMDQNTTHSVPPEYEKHDTGIGISVQAPSASSLQRLIISSNHSTFWSKQSYYHPDDPPYKPTANRYIINLRSDDLTTAKERMQSILADLCVYQIENKRLPSDILKQPKISSFYAGPLGGLAKWADRV